MHTAIGHALVYQNCTAVAELWSSRAASDDRRCERSADVANGNHPQWPDRARREAMNVATIGTIGDWRPSLSRTTAVDGVVTSDTIYAFSCIDRDPTGNGQAERVLGERDA